jgi:hypothetical protein
VSHHTFTHHRLGADTSTLSDFSILPEGALPGSVLPGNDVVVRSDLFLASDDYFVKKRELLEIDSSADMSLLRKQHFQNEEIEHMAFYLASKVTWSDWQFVLHMTNILFLLDQVQERFVRCLRYGSITTKLAENGPARSPFLLDWPGVPH